MLTKRSELLNVMMGSIIQVPSKCGESGKSNASPDSRSSPAPVHAKHARAVAESNNVFPW